MVRLLMWHAPPPGGMNTASTPQSPPERRRLMINHVHLTPLIPDIGNSCPESGKNLAETREQLVRSRHARPQ